MSILNFPTNATMSYQSMLKFLILSFALNIAICKQTISQTGPSEILDTVGYNGRQVLLMSNNKWMYLSDYDKNRSYDSLFKINWITNEIHAYGKERNNHSDEKKLNLLEHGTYVFPLDSFKYLRGFTGYHTGVDLKADKGTNVKAAFDGIVRYASYSQGGYGKLVIIRHYNGLETYYSHLSKILVTVNESVSAGTIIGLVGQTGRATTNHLHFETRFHDNPFRPSAIFNLDDKQLLQDSLLICYDLFNANSNVSNKSALAGGDGEGSVPYTIQKGDTLSKIAQQYNTSVSSLCELNNISSTAILKIGETIFVK